ncbi:sodium phosphate symporter [Micractinium conductrix]|uniref:Sodium phosphate symporter n=1 Tax=Micractinium conductrix TaxID=554055 RepID=A0A2P6VSE1_9CHLO|nr:sodium phosphate symporter [Micractinium conductrix]|eukprot:PSC76970.1 sodium phosphate symporter [Micractinium conductrix]
MNSRYNYAESLTDTNPQEAERLHRQVLVFKQRYYGLTTVYVGTSLNSLGSLLRKRGEWQEAETLLRRALAIREGVPAEWFDAAVTRDELGCLLQATGRVGEAREECQRADWSAHKLIFACATCLSVFVAYGIGANDVANAFGTSVGAKALTMKQAVVVAAICEFGGSVLMGAGVVGTMRKGIAKLSAFENDPDIFAYGMLCAMLATGIWLILATYWELPVSTTHSIVGAIIGMTMVSAGPDAVIWSKKTDTFPFIGGVASLCLSWVFSPLLGGLLAAFLFFFLRLLVLRSPNSYKRAFYVLPIFVFLTFFMITIFTIKEGGSRFGWENTPDGKALWIAAIVGAGTAILSVGWQIWVVRRRVAMDLEEKTVAEAADVAGAVEAAGSDATKEDGDSASEQAAASAQQHTPSALKDFRKSKVWGALTHSTNVDIHQEVADDEKLQAMHDAAEKFDPRAEGVFKYLQVFTACANSFAHGSNDVANSIGPYAAIYAVWQTGTVAKEAEVPTWILVVGGAGIVLGLATYGYKIMKVLGVKMTKLTNSRGFIVEMSAATIVILGSRFGLPLSTTHTLVGAVTGVGLLESRRGGFNGMLLVRFFAGWVATLVVAAITSAAFTAQGIYAPNRDMDKQRYYVAQYLNNTAYSVAMADNNTDVLAQFEGLPNPVLYLNQPSWPGQTTNTLARGNIALMKLDRATVRMAPVANLPAASNNPSGPVPVNGALFLLGWGATKKGGEMAPNLKTGNHYVVDQKACRNKWSGTSPPVINPADWNTKSFFCAENAQAKKSLCRGDLGTPLLRLDGNLKGRDMLVGVGSVTDCTGLGPEGGSVFTSVSFYMPWIRAGVDFLRRGVTSRGVHRLVYTKDVNGGKCGAGIGYSCSAAAQCCSQVCDVKGQTAVLASAEALQAFLASGLDSSPVVAVRFGEDGLPIEDGHLLKLLKSPIAARLQSLRLGSSDTGNGLYVTDRAFVAICERMQHLTVLHLTGNDKSQGKLTKKGLQPLISGKAPQLQQLYITDQQPGLYDTVKKLLRARKNLRVQAGDTDSDSAAWGSVLAAQGRGYGDGMYGRMHGHLSRAQRRVLEEMDNFPY